MWTEHKEVSANFGEWILGRWHAADAKSTVQVKVIFAMQKLGCIFVQSIMEAKSNRVLRPRSLGQDPSHLWCGADVKILKPIFPIVAAIYRHHV